MDKVCLINTQNNIKVALKCKVASIYLHGFMKYMSCLCGYTCQYMLTVYLHHITLVIIITSGGVHILLSVDF